MSYLYKVLEITSDVRSLVLFLLGEELKERRKRDKGNQSLCFNLILPLQNKL